MREGPRLPATDPLRSHTPPLPHALFASADDPGALCHCQLTNAHAAYAFGPSTSQYARTPSPFVVNLTRSEDEVSGWRVSTGTTVHGGGSPAGAVRWVPRAVRWLWTAGR
ncbi:hypothetical protein SGM_3668 [Streptomyces griseoaurantiacus M045]|uniref:Uncharacterized protein n=1 Tax=Streptomyces griseoaurantiacus M045 TaxID=996637 RepID=F3NKK4_9ACTN|nr:hypothetical protein SGM_3668 [Streptomyces griseoaurantiacus M045]